LAYWLTGRSRLDQQRCSTPCPVSAWMGDSHLATVYNQWCSTRIRQWTRVGL